MACRIKDISRRISQDASKDEEMEFFQMEPALMSNWAQFNARPLSLPSIQELFREIYSTSCNVHKRWDVTWIKCVVHLLGRTYLPIDTRLAVHSFSHTRRSIEGALDSTLCMPFTTHVLLISIKRTTIIRDKCFWLGNLPGRRMRANCCVILKFSRG